MRMRVRVRACVRACGWVGGGALARAWHGWLGWDGGWMVLGGDIDGETKMVEGSTDSLLAWGDSEQK